MNTIQRLYSLADAPQIVKLSQEWAAEQITLGYGGDNVWTDERLADRAKGSDPLFWVAEVDGVVVGM